MNCLRLFCASLVIITAASFAHAQDSSLSPSVLNDSVAVQGFGLIRYRGPLPKSTGLPIVLVHGVYGGASHRSMRELLSLLDEAGKAVYILDLPGAGESDKPKRPYSLEDLDTFLEAFLQDVVRARSTVVAESILSASALRVSSKRPDLIRRTVLLSPTGINSLHQPPSEREQRLYDRLYADERGSEGFYRNLLNDSSLSYFLKFAFFDDSFVNEALLNDYRVLRDNIEQRWLTLSFVGGQLYRSFEASAQDVFIPVLALFGAEYEAFADTPPTRASEFQALRPDFEYVEIPKSGSSVQRERPELVAKEIITFSVED